MAQRYQYVARIRTQDQSFPTKYPGVMAKRKEWIVISNLQHRSRYNPYRLLTEAVSMMFTTMAFPVDMSQSNTLCMPFLGGTTSDCSMTNVVTGHFYL